MDSSAYIEWVGVELVAIGGPELALFIWWLWQRTAKMQHDTCDPWDKGCIKGFRCAAIVLGVFEMFFLYAEVYWGFEFLDFHPMLRFLAREPITFAIWSLEPLSVAIPPLLLWRLAPFFACISRRNQHSWPEVFVRAMGVICGALASYPLMTRLHMELIHAISALPTSDRTLVPEGLWAFNFYLTPDFIICEFSALAVLLFFLAPYAARHCLPPPTGDADAAG